MTRMCAMSQALESARALGNFSRSPDVRRTFVEARAIDALVLLLESADPLMVYTCCGVRGGRCGMTRARVCMC